MTGREWSEPDKTWGPRYVLDVKADMTVVVRDADGHAITKHGVSAVGIGHLRKDLVLVYPASGDLKERAEEMGTDWRSLTVELV